MYAACKQLFVTLLLATVWHATYAAYDVAKYCSMIKTGTKLPSTDACSQYFTCTSDGKYTTADCGSGNSFDKNKQNCQPSANVDCYIGLENPCVGKNDAHVPDVSNCGAWFYCLNGEVKAKGKCPAGMALTAGRCDYYDCAGGSTPEENETPVAVCDIMPNNKWFGDTLNCNAYYTCKAGAPITGGVCKDSLVFDVQKELCNYEVATDCTRITGEGLPGPGVVIPCTTADLGNKKPNPNICSGYLACDGKVWAATSCGTGQYWDEAGEACVSRQKATPIATCDRCEGSKKAFVNSVDPTCQGYQVCKDGKKSGTGKCASGYFDEESGACLINAKPTQVDEYAESHGACKAAPGVCACDNVGGVCVGSTDCVGCGFDIDGTTCKECAPVVNGNCPACDCEALAEADCVDAGDGCFCAKTSDVPATCISCESAIGTITSGVCITSPQCQCAVDGDECVDNGPDSCDCGFEGTGVSCVDCDTDVCPDCVCRLVGGVCANAGADAASACLCGLEDDFCTLCDALDQTDETLCAA